MWSVREAWTKFTFPVILSESNVPMNDVIRSFLEREWVQSDTFHSTALWEDRPYKDRELSNLIPSVKLTLTVNQRRLRFNPEVLKGLGIFKPQNPLYTGRGFRFSSIDLHVFFNRIAILVIEICPVNTHNMSIGAIEDVNSAIASIGGGAQIVRTVRGNGYTEDVLTGCTMTSVLNGFPFSLTDFISDILLQPFRMDADTFGYQAVVDTFLPAFGAVLLELEEPLAEITSKEIAEAFEKFAAEHLTVLRKTLPSDSANVLAHQIFGEPEHNYMPYHNVIHSQSLEGGFILAFDNGSPHFHKHPAPAMESFRTHYFNIILIALHQRLSILKYMMMAAEASMVEERFFKLRDLREQIYDFTSRCYFTQVSMSEERDQLFRRWQRAFHVLEMYDELKEEVAEIQDYLADIIRTQDNEHQQWRMQNENSRTLVYMYISVLFLPITVVLNVIIASPIWIPWLNFHLHPIRAWLSATVSLVTVLFVVFEGIRMWRRWGNGKYSRHS